MNLEEAQDELRRRLLEGEAVECPCCTQLAKIYRRKIHATMARHLILMYRADSDDGWFHMGTVLGGPYGDAAKLSYWNLIEEAPERRVDGGRAGWWRVTDRGRAFVERELVVPEYARIYDGRLLSYEGDGVRITDALGEKFDYGELMSQ